MRLFDFTSTNMFEEKIYLLSLKCNEKWSFDGKSDLSILKNYIFHTFEKVYEEGKVIETDTYSIFNTGLFDNYYEEIYCLFDINRVKNRQKWNMLGFYVKYQISSLGYCIANFPKRANYFERSSDLIFDSNCEIVPQWNHIFGKLENLNRLPEAVKNDPRKQMLFEGALSFVRKLIDANYKTAIPQFYDGKVQLLIPIFLSGIATPDLALVVTKDPSSNKYYGHTCLSLDMAYNNARLIARPNSEWLKA